MCSPRANRTTVVSCANRKKKPSDDFFAAAELVEREDVVVRRTCARGKFGSEQAETRLWGPQTFYTNALFGVRKLGFLTWFAWRAEGRQHISAQHGILVGC